jgi:hypothetical protein
MIFVPLATARRDSNGSPADDREAQAHELTGIHICGAMGAAVDIMLPSA